MPDSDFFLFISHVAENRVAALEVVEELERRGTRCWIAPRDIRPGMPFDDEIVAAIENSRAMLLIFSDFCNDSEYIRREVTVAGESHKSVIPFRVENAQPRKGLRVRLSDLHWIDGFVSRERAIDEVIKTITPPAASQDVSAAEASGDGDGRKISAQAGSSQKPAQADTSSSQFRDKPARALSATTWAALAGGVLIGVLALGLVYFVNSRAPLPQIQAPLRQITAAIQWPNNKAIFFVNDGRYFRYDKQADRMDPGYPKPINDNTWPGMAQYAGLIAAACNGPNGTAYVFLSDGRYLRYDIQADRMEAGYPKPIDDTTWPGMGRYSAAISSALNWKDGKIQFFLKNGQYIRFDVATNRADDGYPQDITENVWPGLASYKKNLAGMINWDNGKVYMFLNNGQYLRYDIQADRTDAGYPKLIGDETWPGMDAALRSR